MRQAFEKDISKRIMSVIIIGVVVWFLYLVRGILLPFILSGIIAYILSPFVSYFQSLGLKRSVSVVSLYLVFIALFIWSIILIVPKTIDEIYVLKNNIPQYATKIKESVPVLRQTLETKLKIKIPEEVMDTGIKKATEFINEELTRIPSFIMGLFSLFSLFVLIPVITFFFLLSGRKIMDTLVDLMPGRYVETTLSLICEIDESLGKFLRAQVVESSCVGILSIIGLLVLGIDYAVLIGIIAGIGNMIPYLGPAVGTIPAIIIGVIKFQSISIVLKIVIMFVIVQFIDNNFLQPIIYSHGVKLHPIVIIFAIMAGAEIFGVLGMLFAVPVACVIKVIIEILLRKPATTTT